MAKKKHNVVLVGLIFLLSSLVIGCNGGATAAEATPTPEGPPPAFEDVLAQVEDAVAGLASYRFSALWFTNMSVEMQQFRLSGAWAAPDSFEMRQEGTGRAEGSVNEVVMVDGVAASRMTGGNTPSSLAGEWRDSPYPEGWEPSILHGLTRDFPADARDTSVRHGVLQGQPTYVLSWEWSAPLPEGYLEQWPDYQPPVTAHTLHVDRERYLPLRLETHTTGLRTQPPPTDGGTPTPTVADGWTQVAYDFFDFNEPISITLPEGWQPRPTPPPRPEPTVPSATLVYRLERDVDDLFGWNELHSVLRTRLALVGINPRSFALTGPRELTVVLSPGTVPLEQVDALLRAPGRVDVVERVCATAECEHPDDYEDRPTGITEANVWRANSFVLMPVGRVGLVLRLDEDGTAKLATVTERLARTYRTESPDQLVVLLDGELLMASPISAPVTDGGIQIIGIFTAPEEAEALAALLNTGPLPVGLTLARMEVDE